MATPKRVVIIAESYARALHYCKTEGLNPNSRNVTIASNAYVLRGLSGPLDVRYVGEWFRRRDAIEVSEYIGAIEAVTVSVNA